MILSTHVGSFGLGVTYARPDSLQGTVALSNVIPPVVLLVPGVYSVEVLDSVRVYVCPFLTASGYWPASSGVNSLCVVFVTCWVEPGVLVVTVVYPAGLDPWTLTCAGPTRVLPSGCSFNVIG